MSPVQKARGAADYLPDRHNLKALREAAQSCRGCPLHQNATQTVFGEGLKRARLMLVGEMPGDKEDRSGKPFVGPAGRILDEVLEAAGIERRDAYVTNTVKHFKWEARGKHRLHKKPTAAEIRACLPWLRAEIEVVQPQVFVCLGATAAKAMLGSDFRITREHGELIESDLARYTTATAHPSAILRKPERAERERAKQELIEDFEKIAELLHGN
jgi:DNA polymerase